MSSSMSSATSSRTGGPKRRRSSSFSSAWSRFSARLPRPRGPVAGDAERWCSRTSMPGEEAPPGARCRSSSRRPSGSRRLAALAPRGCPATRTQRGTSAAPSPGRSRCLGGRWRTVAHHHGRGSATGRRCTGTGGPGRRPAGSAPGRSARGKRAEPLLLGRAARPADDADALLGQLRATLAPAGGVPLHRARRRRADTSSSSPVRARPGAARARPVAIRRLRPATRTMKNSSRLLAKMARNFARSSSGIAAGPRPARAPVR